MCRSWLPTVVDRRTPQFQRRRSWMLLRHGTRARFHECGTVTQAFTRPVILIILCERRKLSSRKSSSREVLGDPTGVSPQTSTGAGVGSELQEDVQNFDGIEKAGTVIQAVGSLPGPQGETELKIVAEPGAATGPQSIRPFRAGTLCSQSVGTRRERATVVPPGPSHLRYNPARRRPNRVSRAPRSESEPAPA